MNCDVLTAQTKEICTDGKKYFQITLTEDQYNDTVYCINKISSDRARQREYYQTKVKGTYVPVDPPKPRGRKMKLCVVDPAVSVIKT